jgi:hypothetical protein
MADRSTCEWLVLVHKYFQIVHESTRTTTTNPLVPNKFGSARAETHQVSQQTHDFGTWIASFHAGLSMASSLVTLQSFRSLFMDSSHMKFGVPDLSWHYQHALAIRNRLKHLEACIEYAQTILNGVGQASWCLRTHLFL